jgi:hypothetical protein
MVAYNFSEDFAEAVAARVKRQTLRRQPRAKVGDALQLYTGQRTQGCRKLTEVDPICTRTGVVHLYENHMLFDGYNQTPETADGYAQFDGFENYKAMYAWFKERYGEVPQPLYETRWAWPEEKPTESPTHD